MQLKRTQIFSRRSVRGSAQEGSKPLDGTDVLALRIGGEPAHAHVFEHALAQRADGLLAHWGSCLEVGVLDPSILKTERPPRHPRSINVVTVPHGLQPGRLLPR